MLEIVLLGCFSCIMFCTGSPGGPRGVPSEGSLRHGCDWWVSPPAGPFRISGGLVQYHLGYLLSME